MASSNQSKQKKPHLLDGLAAAGIFTAAMALYVRTLATTLLLGDSAEFQTLAYTLGLAHGTGYPVYILLTKVFTLLVPVRDIAYRVNLFSAVCAALTLALVYLLARALGGRRTAALVGAAALGVCWLFWWHAVIAEVYDPAAAIIALVLLLVVIYRKTGNVRLLFWAGLSGGLGLGIHYAVLLAAPAVLVYLFLTIRTRERRTAWLNAAGGAMLGLALYFASFLALDLYHAPSTNYQAVMQPSLSVLDIAPQQFASRLGRIWYLASGKQFQGELFSLPVKQVIGNTGKYFVSLWTASSQVGLILTVLGLVGTFFPRPKGTPSRWREGLLLLIAWLAMLVYIVNYDIGDDFVFYIPGYVPLAILTSLGASMILDLVSWLAEKVGNKMPRPAQWSVGLVGLVLVAAALWPSIPTLQESWKLRRISFLDYTDYAGYPYPVMNASWPHIQAKAIANLVEDNAIIFTDWGWVYPIYYVTHVEEGRTGIAVHETYPAMKPHPFADSALEYLRENIGKRPIYFVYVDERVAQEYQYIPVGTGFDLYRLEKH